MTNPAIFQHIERINDMTFSWFKIDDRVTLTCTKPKDEIDDETLINLCLVIGANLPFLTTDRGVKVKSLSKDERETIFKSIGSTDIDSFCSIVECKTWWNTFIII